MAWKGFLLISLSIVLFSCSDSGFNDLINKEAEAYNSIVPAPTLYNPSNGSSSGSRMPTFKWNSSMDGVVYRLEISDKADFSNILVSRDEINGTEYTLAGSEMLPSSGVFYWTVIAKDLLGRVSTRPLYVLTIDTEIPVVQTSVDKTEVYPDKTFNLSFTVNKSGSYIVYRSKFSDFRDENILKAGVVTSSSVGKAVIVPLTGEDLFSGAINYLRVKLTDHAGNEGMGNVSISRREYSLVSAIITSPGNGTYIQTLAKDANGVIIPNALILQGSAKYDDNTAIEDDDYFTWSSDKDGVLGTGRHLIPSTALQPGDHKITLTVDDGNYGSDVAEIIIHVPHVYTEDFSTTTYLDVANTTGVWDTGSTLRGAHLGPEMKYEFKGTFDALDIPTGGSISGKYLYMTDAINGIIIIDITNSANPIFKGAYNTAGGANDVVISGQYAYVAGLGNGLAIVDVLNPAIPLLKGSCDTAGSANSVFVAGNYAYVADGNNGLVIIDISNPANPILKGTYDTAGIARGVSISGNFAFLSDFTNGLVIIDISNPNNPTLIATYYVERLLNSVTSKDNLVYVLDADNGLLIIDVSNPSSPALTGKYKVSTYNNVVDLAVSGDYAYIVDYDKGLVVVNISNPSAPVFNSSREVLGPEGVAVSGNCVYVYTSSGVEIFDGFPVNQTIAGLYTTENIAIGVAISGDYAYVADYNKGLKIIDIQNPSVLTLKGVYAMSDIAGGVAASGDFVYITEGAKGLVVLDVSNPSIPALKGSYDTAGSAVSVYVKDSHAYVADGTNGLVIIDVSNPASPTLKGSYNTAGYASGIVIYGSNAYIADGSNGLVIIDISNPSNPLYKGSFDTAGSSIGLAVSGNYAFIADDTNDLVIVDISNTTAPTLAGTYNPPGYSINGVAISDNFLYISDYQYGLVVLDVASPTTPVLKCIYETEGLTYGIAESGKFVYVVTGYGIDYDGNGLLVTYKLKPYIELFSLTTKTVQSKDVAFKSVKSARVLTEYRESTAFSKITELTNAGIASSSWIPVADGVRTEFGLSPNGTFIWRSRFQTSTIYETPLIRKLAIEYWE